MERCLGVLFSRKKIDIPEDIRAKKGEITGNVRDVKRNKICGSPYLTLKQKRRILGKRFCEEVSKYSF